MLPFISSVYNLRVTDFRSQGILRAYSGDDHSHRVFFWGGVSVSGLWTFRIIEINKEKIIAEKNNFTNKQNFFCIRHLKNYCFVIPAYTVANSW